jgi:hypothetical protein
MVSLDQSVEATDAFASAEVDDERVLLNTERGEYYGLNPVGDRVLRIIEQKDHVSVRSIVDRLHADFPDVEYDSISEDVRSFIDDMEEYDLLLVHD